MLDMAQIDCCLISHSMVEIRSKLNGPHFKISIQLTC